LKLDYPGCGKRFADAEASSIASEAETENAIQDNSNAFPATTSPNEPRRETLDNFFYIGKSISDKWCQFQLFFSILG
jgi:hypothetical protein